MIRLENSKVERFLDELESAEYPESVPGFSDLSDYICDIFTLDSAIMGCLLKRHVMDKDYEFIRIAFNEAERHDINQMRMQFVDQKKFLEKAYCYHKKLEAVYNYIQGIYK